ncbi:hypothetical protein Ate02nite_77710 [Paractinoplanes tereljensis]|uniref:Uncharacterized protein n=1 Tax=Paractinoplanes tereljensis TaxID=571912 RepID=A0A919TWE7_9ACTN|nr:hypothetical protein Ate02nite_77710 [Actinoplanes tereljensis]
MAVAMPRRARNRTTATTAAASAAITATTARALPTCPITRQMLWPGNTAITCWQGANWDYQAVTIFNSIEMPRYNEVTATPTPWGELDVHTRPAKQD